MTLYGVKDNTKNLKEKICILLTEEIYWRKANQIHKWFVENVQYGQNICAYYYLEREELESLKKACEDVLKNPDLADKILPTQEGFFFGSTKYDKWYFKNLEFTINEINRLLDEDKYEEYMYHASY